ncbi:hypothetical protein TEA_022081 [Camellia sinensis var. sinensis]|uniref:DC-UbP/UBTD2 N-terminal domain-containing protein n=1 Tax=Camellia sinensis var. sinensis TaxID=542762 RepID=A0A4S4DKJ1_CAMSN|nr:hypothetical protein TEA_022081 [Camellia sinensis var. sinensis]
MSKLVVPLHPLLRCLCSQPLRVARDRNQVQKITPPTRNKLAALPRIRAEIGTSKRDYEEDPKAKTLEAFFGNNKESTYEDARGVLGHCSSLWWQERDYEEDPKAKTLEAFFGNNKESTYEDARGVLGHCSSLWWQERDYEEDPKAKTLEAFFGNNKESTYEDARGVLGHCSSLWWQESIAEAKMGRVLNDLQEFELTKPQKMILYCFYYIEIWDALHAAVDADLTLAQAIVDSAGIIVQSADLTVCYDERGAKYEIPKYVLSEPTNLIQDS